MGCYKVTGIKWDTDGAEVNLPKQTIISCKNEDQVVDKLSDMYGFCIESVETIEKQKAIKFGVVIDYTSGRQKTEYHTCKNKKLFWEWFDKHHNRKIIDTAYIFSFTRLLSNES